MEWSDCSLRDKLNQGGPLNPHEARAVLVQILEGLVYLQEEASKLNLSFVHRDLKPENVLIDEDSNTYKISDFGIAKFAPAASHPQTFSGGAYGLGTVYYMAPEQFQDAANVDGRADVYSVGVIGYELLTGSLPFPAQEPWSSLADKLAVTEEQLRRKLVGSGVPSNEPIIDVIVQALHPDRDKRYPGALHMNVALRG